MSQYSSPDPSLEKERGRQRPSYVREWSLRPWGYAFLFLIPIVALSGVFGWQTFRVSRAIYQLDSISIPVLLHALQQDPGNADLLHRLGSTYSIDPVEANVPEAIKYLRQAAQTNPRRWDYWSDLGIVCDEIGDTACSDAAFERAAAINPHTPALLWALGNHYLLTDRAAMSFPVFRRLILLEPSYLESTMRICFSATRDPQAIYTQVIPTGTDAYPRFAFLRFLAAAADYESAMKIWQQMISGPDPAPKMSLVKMFLDYLVAHNQVDAATTVWTELQHNGVIPPNPPANAANIIFNSDFEREPLNTGFDWNVTNSSDLEIDLADPSGRGGGKCIRVDFFVGRDLDYDLVDQMVRVLPGTRYQLSAYVRSTNLSSDSGPRLRAVEVGCPSCPVRTSDGTLGTTRWHPVRLEFVTEQHTRAVRVSFWRPHQQNFSKDITGTVWLDDVTLRAVGLPSVLARQARSQ